jgi:uncharacterized membrane protein
MYIRGYVGKSAQIREKRDPLDLWSYSMYMRRLILLVFGFSVLLLALQRLRAYKLKERYTLLFFCAGAPFLGLAAWPGAIGWLALKMHIEYGTVSLLCVAAFLIVMLLELLTIVSLQDRKIATLAQIVGIMMEKHGMSDRNLMNYGDGDRA